MGDAGFTTFLVDDDPAVLRSITRLLRAGGYKTKSFSSPQKFLSAHDPSVPGCAIIDQTDDALAIILRDRQCGGGLLLSLHHIEPQRRRGRRALEFAVVRQHDIAGGWVDHVKAHAAMRGE